MKKLSGQFLLFALALSLAWGCGRVNSPNEEGVEPPSNETSDTEEPGSSGDSGSEDQPGAGEPPTVDTDTNSGDEICDDEIDNDSDGFLDCDDDDCIEAEPCVELYGGGDDGMTPGDDSEEYPDGTDTESNPEETDDTMTPGDDEMTPGDDSEENPEGSDAESLPEDSDDSMTPEEYTEESPEVPGTENTPEDFENYDPEMTPEDVYPKCDPNLMCAEVITCVDYLLYRTSCGPDNCDDPIDTCGDDYAMPSVD